MEYAGERLGSGAFAMKNYSLKAALAVTAIVGSFALAGSAYATLTVDTGSGGAMAGATLDNLDWLALGGGGSTGPTVSGVTISFAADGGAVQGTTSQYAQPFLSGNNGNGFGPGGIKQGDGQDATTYVSSGGIQGSNVTFVLPTGESYNYFGLLWGSVDKYNTLTFYNDLTLVGTLTGVDVTAAANGDRGAEGTFYVNVTSSKAFNRVVGTSSSYAFEIDNIAFGRTVPAPEPITLSLFGAGLAGLGFARRRKTQAK
jgi:hypothetical protein